MAHVLIARLVSEGKLALDAKAMAREVAVAVAADPVLQRTPTPRGAARRALHVAVRSYWAYFLPEEGSTLVGSEVELPGATLDLVWRSPNGDVWADELKLRRVGLARMDVSEQVTRQLLAGGRRWGSDFLGVRVCFLVAPRASFMAYVDGDEEALFA